MRPGSVAVAFGRLRFLSALGMGGEWSLGVALVMECWPEKSRPLLAGLIGAAANVGFILTGLLVTVVQTGGLNIAGGGWRWVLAACVFPAILTFSSAPLCRSRRNGRRRPHRGRERASRTFSLRYCVPTLIGTALACVALIGTWGSVTWIPAWVLNMTRPTAGGEQRADVFRSGGRDRLHCGALAGGRLGRRRTYFCMCLGSLVVCAYLFRWQTQLHPVVDGWFLAVVMLTAALTASFYGWLPLYLPELFPTRVRATGQGFAYNAGRIIAAGGGLSMGFLMSKDLFNGRYDRGVRDHQPHLYRRIDDHLAGAGDGRTAAAGMSGIPWRR